MALPKFDITFNNAVVTIDPQSYIPVEADMNEALHKVSASYCEIASYIAHFKHAKELESIAYNAAWSRRYHELKSNAYEQLYQKKPTEVALEYALNEDKLMQGHKRNIADFQKTVDQLYAVLTAISMKLDVLKELGSHIRSDKRMRDMQ